MFALALLLKPFVGKIISYKKGLSPYKDPVLTGFSIYANEIFLHFEFSPELRISEVFDIQDVERIEVSSEGLVLTVFDKRAESRIRAESIFKFPN